MPFQSARRARVARNTLRRTKKLHQQKVLKKPEESGFFAKTCGFRRNITRILFV
jgi:hypothetical protein